MGSVESAQEAIDFKVIEKIIVEVLPCDGIGLIIMKQAFRILEYAVKDKILAGGIEIRHVEGMTIENCAALKESLPKEVLRDIKKCALLKALRLWRKWRVKEFSNMS